MQARTLFRVEGFRDQGLGFRGKDPHTIPLTEKWYGTLPAAHLSHKLNSLKGLIQGTTIEVIRGILGV